MYSNYIASPNYSSKLVKSNAINNDIIQTIHANFQEAVRQTKNLAPQLQLATPFETCSNIWHLLKKEINYKKDSSTNQLIRLPARFLSDKQGDCKSYSLFTAAVLKNLYPHLVVKLRYASYNPFSEIPTHVYCVLYTLNGQEIIIDGVYKKFNEEKKYTYKKDYTMNVYTLSGLEQEGVGKFGDGAKNLLKKVKKAVKKVASKAKTVVASPMRGAFLGLVALNVRALATNISTALKKNESAVKNLWVTKFGGDFNQLKQTVSKGEKKKMLFGVGGIGEPVTAATATVAIAAAAPVIIAVSKLLKTLGIKDKNLDDIESAAESQLPPNEVANAQSDGATAAEEEKDQAGKPTGLSTQTMLLIGGGVAAAAFLLTRKK